MKAERFERRRSICIDLRGMLAAIQFDHEALLGAQEVGNRVPDRRLSSKLQAAELPIAEVLPKYPLNIRSIAAELFCVTIGSADRHGTIVAIRQPSSKLR